jgi:DNA-binding helix-hairpin-helix protein with protein kinase domain
MAQFIIFFLFATFAAVSQAETKAEEFKRLLDEMTPVTDRQDFASDRGNRLTDAAVGDVREFDAIEMQTLGGIVKFMRKEQLDACRAGVGNSNRCQQLFDQVAEERDRERQKQDAVRQQQIANQLHALFEDLNADLYRQQRIAAKSGFSKDQVRLIELARDQLFESYEESVRQSKATTDYKDALAAAEIILFIIDAESGVSNDG